MYALIMISMQFVTNIYIRLFATAIVGHHMMIKLLFTSIIRNCNPNDKGGAHKALVHGQKLALLRVSVGDVQAETVTAAMAMTTTRPAMETETIGNKKYLIS